MTPKMFYETEPDGYVSFGYAYKEELVNTKTLFQEMRVIDTYAYGKMLILDEKVMLTDFDEFVYHEMISHVPMAFHPNAKKVLVIGGGDGGTVRELLRYPSVEKIVLCEIDGQVVDACREYFPQVAGQLDDPRVEVRIGDGIEYMKSCKNEFDVILIDSSDPIGPAVGLFTKEFYSNVNAALKADGVMAAQSETPWRETKVLASIFENIQSQFPVARPYTAGIPSYPRGLWSWTIASKDGELKNRLDTKALQSFEGELSYLRADSVMNAFVLPQYHARKLNISPSF